MIDMNEAMFKLVVHARKHKFIFLDDSASKYFLLITYTLIY